MTFEEYQTERRLINVERDNKINSLNRKYVCLNSKAKTDSVVTDRYYTIKVGKITYSIFEERINIHFVGSLLKKNFIEYKNKQHVSICQDSQNFRVIKY